MVAGSLVNSKCCARGGNGARVGGTVTRRGGGEWKERRGKMEKGEGVVRSTSEKGERYATVMRLTSMARRPEVRSRKFNVHFKAVERVSSLD